MSRWRNGWIASIIALAAACADPPRPPSKEPPRAESPSLLGRSEARRTLEPLGPFPPWTAAPVDRPTVGTVDCARSPRRVALGRPVWPPSVARNGGRTRALLAEDGGRAVHLDDAGTPARSAPLFPRPETVPETARLAAGPRAAAWIAKRDRDGALVRWGGGSVEAGSRMAVPGLRAVIAVAWDGPLAAVGRVADARRAFVVGDPRDASRLRWAPLNASFEPLEAPICDGARCTVIGRSGGLRALTLGPEGPPRRRALGEWSRAPRLARAPSRAWVGGHDREALHVARVDANGDAAAIVRIPNVTRYDLAVAGDGARLAFRLDDRWWLAELGEAGLGAVRALPLTADRVVLGPGSEALPIAAIDEAVRGVGATEHAEDTALAGLRFGRLVGGRLALGSPVPADALASLRERVEPFGGPALDAWLTLEGEATDLRLVAWIAPPCEL
ncbi:MAG TPA: hypothetical protein RMH99_23580 [Sandaracinaceae bacterium LLY-WYZ-13_1]|nr:hypothetical protein [Sandaracinaceae bacterium LLY-WYZ-13_1]